MSTTTTTQDDPETPYINLHPTTVPDLTNAFQVDQAILHEPSKLVVIRFGDHNDPLCKRQDDVLDKCARRTHAWCVFYKCDNRPGHVPDFNQMYELYDRVTVMFFFRNKQMMCDFGTGNNNKINWCLDDGREMVDILEVVYKGATKGRGLVNSPKGGFFFSLPGANGMLLLLLLLLLLFFLVLRMLRLLRLAARRATMAAVVVVVAVAPVPTLQPVLFY